MESGLTINKVQLQPTVSDYASIQRKKWVMDQYLAGRLPYDIRNDYIETYKLSTHSFDNDVSWMNKELRRQGENEIEAIIERHTDRYNYVYSLAIAKGDLRSAAQALKGIEDLYRIHKDKIPSSVTVNNTQNINLPKMSVEEIRSLLGRNESQVIDIEEAKTE